MKISFNKPRPASFRGFSKRIGLLLGILFLGWSAYSQTDPSNKALSDSTHHRMQRHHGDWNKGGNGDFSKNGPGFGRGHAFGNNREGGWGGYSSRGPGVHGRFGGRGRHGGPRIQYSPEQRKQIAALHKEYRQKQEDLYKNDKMTLGEYKSKLLALQKDRKSKMQALLTPEQKDKQAQWKKRSAENAQVMAAARLERMKITLNLSDAQAASLRTQQADMRQKMQSIREDDNLLPQQKMEEMKMLALKRQDVFKSVLTPEQLSKFEAMHKRHWGGGPGHGAGMVN